MPSSADQDAKRQVHQEIAAVEARFRAERERHSAAQAELREELFALVARADELGVSITALSKTVGTSRGRIKRMLYQLRPGR